jgi:4-hydroxy-3-methylbut-2-enyl diphosphate reductase
MGQVDRPPLLVTSAADVERLDLPSDTRVAYVTQTTLSVDDTREVIAALGRRFGDVVGPDTGDICYATQNRQSAVRVLCRVADVILVVGAANSSNSNRLREIGDEMGKPSYVIADERQLRPEWFDNAHTVGLTAGASAPEELVSRVVDALRRIGPVQTSMLAGPIEDASFRLPRELLSH